MVDLALDDRELGRLRALSSWTHTTPTSFVSHDEWGTFRGDAQVLVERYLPAFLPGQLGDRRCSGAWTPNAPPGARTFRTRSGGRAAAGTASG